ncbi:NAD-dependent epimerase/dehydratase family protein [Streptomyces sp. NPDC059786]|uniref:NAD-dependent epimerase/dehydratase family protein n=1 Tax=Streptomyces sp. NPDC059786 TaxID=3346946 RepID=UPI00365BAEDB
MAVVVTGAAGFIGTHVVEALSSAGHSVIGVDRRPAPPRRRFRSLTVDLLDGDPGCEQALRSADAVIHLAGQPGVRDRSPGIELRQSRDNVDATAKVIELVSPSVPLVVASSSSVYGGSRSGRASLEDDAIRPRGSYAASKVRAEMLCARRAEAGGTVAVCRPFTVAGEGQRPDMALARWIRAVANGEPVRIFGSPDRSRDITDVRDVATALLLLLNQRGATTVNVGTGSGHTLGSLVTMVGRAVGREPRTQIVPAPFEDPTDTLADTARLRRLTGLRPHTDVQTLVERQVHASLTTECPAQQGRA